MMLHLFNFFKNNFIPLITLLGSYFMIMIVYTTYFSGFALINSLSRYNLNACKSTTKNTKCIFDINWKVCCYAVLFTIYAINMYIISKPDNKLLLLFVLSFAKWQNCIDFKQ